MHSDWCPDEPSIARRPRFLVWAMDADSVPSRVGVAVTWRRLMEAGPPALVEVTWSLIQTLPVNENIYEELESMGGRCEGVPGAFYRGTGRERRAGQGRGGQA